MSDYTPTTAQVREATIASGYYDRAEFDRWLAAHDAEVASTALTEVWREYASGSFSDSLALLLLDDPTEQDVAAWLAQYTAEKRAEWEAEQGKVEWAWQWCYVEKWADGSGVYERVTLDTLKKARRYLRDNAEHLAALNAQATDDDRVVASIEKRRVTEPGPWVPVNENGENDG